MTTYICKCGQRVQKSGSADNTGNRLEGYGPGHECYGCPYAMPWGGNKWDEAAKRFVQDIKGYECRMSRTLSYDSHFIGSTKDKCTCSVFSLDFDFLEQISAWVKDTFPLGELTGGFSRDEVRPTDYSHNGRYCCTFVCASNKKGIAAKAALFEHFFNSGGSRKDMTPQQEMEKVLTDIKKATQAKEKLECTTMDSAAPSENADASSATGGAPLTTGTTLMTKPAHSAPQDKTPTSFPMNSLAAPTFDYAGLDTQTVDVLHMAESQYSKGKKMAETGLRWMVNAVSMAHDALCSTVVQQLDNGSEAGVVPQWDNSKHGNRGEDSFRAWCASIGVSKSSAYRLLSVSEKFGNIEVDGKSILDVQPATLLYEAAKPSAPADMVQKATTCEITSSAEYRAVLKENQQLRTDRVNAMNQAEREKQRADAAEKSAQNARKENAYFKELVKSAEAQTSKDAERREEAESRYESALADISGLKEQNAQLKERADSAEAREEEAWKMQSKAEARAKNAEGQLSGSRQVAEAAKLRADKLKAENDALKKQPITAVVDKEEVERQAREMAAEMTADLRAQLEQASSGSEQDAHSSYDNVLLADRSFQNIGKMVVPSLRRLPPEQREQLTNMLVHTLGQIQGEVSRCL